jgi:IclR family pca regulon transcriptional regulator
MLPTLGMIVVESWELRDYVMPAVRQIALETGETACCAILDGADVLTIASVPGQQRLRFAIVPGERAPAAITADGKVLLAALPPERVLRTVALDHPAYPGKSKPWLRRLLQELEEVSRTGVGYDLEEHQPDMRGVAVPIRNHRGTVSAAMMVAAPSSRLDDVRIKDVAQTLKAHTPQGIPWTADSGLRPA